MREKNNMAEFMKEYNLNIKNEFNFWLKKETSIKRESTIKNYLEALDDLESWWNENKDEPIQIWEDPFPFISKYNQKDLFHNSTELYHYDKKIRGGNGAISAAFGRYVNFLEIYQNRINITGINKIFFGSPGSGKSYRIRQFIRENGISNYTERRDYDNVFRITLHPEYSYSDFIGEKIQIATNINDENIITNIYETGPFTKALKYAIKHPNQIVYLILEELSRANIATVFGDIFQLLDRETDGVSEYSIVNNYISNEIYGVSGKNIRIPRNLFLLGTANLSSSRPMPIGMDISFKRRFEFEYVDANRLAYHSNGMAMNNYSFYLKSNNQSLEFNWINLYLALNRFITDKNYGLSLPENKQLGQFFIKFSDDENKNYQQLLNKLLEYLWNDVECVSDSSQSLFIKGKDGINNFSDLYEKAKNKENIFSEEFLKEYNQNI